MKLAEVQEKLDICNAIGSHHEEVEMQTLLAPIVQVCDAISENVLEPCGWLSRISNDLNF